MSARTKGFDISSNNGPLSPQFFRAAFKNGYRFVFIKVTEGTNYVNRYAKDHAKWARDAGLLVGGYDFVSPKSGRTPVEEADFFVKNARDAGLLKKGDLRPAADVEVTSLLAVRASRRYHYRFVERLLNHHKIVRPFIYTAKWFWDGVLQARNTHKCPLWLASYTSKWRSLIPTGWSKVTILQSTDKGTVVPGYGNFDIDTYFGSLHDLKRYHTLKSDH